MHCANNQKYQNEFAQNIPIWRKPAGTSNWGQKSQVKLVTKDKWDKADICAKFVAPIAVGLLVVWWNIHRTNSNTAAQMMQIAVGILGEEVVPDDPAKMALRDWAIEVLKEPSTDAKLSPEAAEALRSTTLANIYDSVFSKGQFATTGRRGGVDIEKRIVGTEDKPIDAEMVVPVE